MKILTAAHVWGRPFPPVRAPLCSQTQTLRYWQLTTPQTLPVHFASSCPRRTPQYIDNPNYAHFNPCIPVAFRLLLHRFRSSAHPAGPDVFSFLVSLLAFGLVALFALFALLAFFASFALFALFALCCLPCFPSSVPWRLGCIPRNGALGPCCLVSL